MSRKQPKQSIGLDEFKRHTGALMEQVKDVFKLTNEEIRGIHQKLDSHSKTLESHTQMIGQLMTDVAEIKFDLKRKVSYEDFAKLEKRVARMEMKLRA